MVTVKFKSIDKAKRTATFDIDGEIVTRGIPEKFEGPIDKHLTALASGLAIEYRSSEVTVIETPKMKGGRVLVDSNPTM